MLIKKYDWNWNGSGYRSEEVGDRECGIFLCEGIVRGIMVIKGICKVECKIM